MRTASLLFVGLVLCAMPVHGDVYNDISISEMPGKHSLSQSTVVRVFQDSRGLMWFGTQAGIDRFDGHGIRVYSNDPDDPNSLSNNDVYTIAEDKDGFLWIGTVGGLNRLNVRTGAVQRFLPNDDDPDSIGSVLILSIGIDPEGIVWVGTYEGIYRYLPKEDRFEDVTPATLEDRRITAVWVSADGTPWAGTRGASLLVWNKVAGKFDILTIPDELQSPPHENQKFVRFSFDDLPDGRILVGGGTHGLFILDPKSNEWQFVSNELLELLQQHASTITDVLRGTRDDYWVATFGAGLVRLDADGVIHEIYGTGNADYYGLDSDSVLDICRDQSGLIWLGTLDRSVKRLQTHPFKRITFHPLEDIGLAEKVAVSVLEDSQGNLWVGHFDGLERVETSGERKFYRSFNGPDGAIPLSYITFLAEPEPGTVLVGGSPMGLLRVNASTLRARRVTTHPIFLFGTAAAMERVWGPAMNQGFFRINASTGEMEQFMPQDDDGVNLTNRMVTTVTEDRTGVVWIGTNDGLFTYDTRTQTYASWYYDPAEEGKRPMIGSNDVLMIHHAADGTIWVSTVDGLFGIDGREVTHAFTEENGLPDKMVYAAVDDDSGRIWAATNDGLCAINPDTGEIQIFTVDDGLPSNEFNQAAAQRLSDGHLLFGTMNGVVRFDPAQVSQSAFAPHVIISQMTAGGERIPDPFLIESDEPFTLPWEQRDLTFRYAALDFVHPDRIRFSYMLEGYDKSWHEAEGVTFATYTNVPAGDYTFRVRATNSDGIWSENHAAVRLRMQPPFWGTWWFISGEVLMAILAVVGIVVAWSGRVRAQRDHLKREVDARTAELKSQRDELAALNRDLQTFNYSVSHDLRSPLHAISEYSAILLSDYGDTMDDAGHKMLIRIHKSALNMNDLVESLLTLARVGKAKLELIDVNLSIIARSLAASLQEQMPGRKGEFRIADDLTARADERLVTVVLTNLLENAWKYTGRREAAVIEFDSVEQNGEQVFFVRDNGVGFPPEQVDRLFHPFERLHGSAEFPGSGIGLTIVHRIVERHGGRIWAESGKGQGATFYFTL